MTYLQAIIKVNSTEPLERQAKDIEDGISYACALLMDEYGRTADEIGRLLEGVTDECQDYEIRRSA